MDNKILNITNLAENYSKETTPKNNSTHNNLWKALLFLLPSLLLAAFTVFYTVRSVDEKYKNEFAVTCDEIAVKISSRLHSHAELLRSGSALFAASGNVSRENWKSFYKTSKIEKNLPGIQGLGFSTIIPKNELQKHIRSIRSEGYPEYTVTPLGERDLYTSIIYLEPFAGRNLRAFGYDMFSEPIRKKAMELARDSDVAALSGKVVLVQETKEEVQAGALMYVPVYRNGMPVSTLAQRRNAIIGWVYSPYRMNDLMKGILGRWDINHLGGIKLQLYDDSLSNASLIYDSEKNDSLKITGSPSRILTFPTFFHGKKWILFFSEYGGPIPYFDGKVIAVTVSGVLINIFLFLLILTLLNTKRNAQRIAEQLIVELKASESKLRAILDNSFDAIALHVDGICVMCNTATLRLFGFSTKNEIIGHPILNLIAASEQPRIKEYISNRIQGISAPICYTTIGVKTDGAIFDLEVSLSMFNHLDTPYVLVILRDITEKKKAEWQKEQVLDRLHKIASRVPGVVYQYLLRPDGSSCFPFASDAIREIYRVEPEEVREDASKVFEILHPDDYAAVADSINQSATELLPWKHEYRVKFTDGIVRWLYGNAIPQKEEDGSVLWHGFITDITERKKLENELQEYTSQLKKSNEDLGNFAYVASHDLKAPLNAVRSILNIIDDGKESPNSTNKLEYIRMAKLAVEQMTGLIKDLLDYSRVGTNKESFSNVNLNEILDYILLVLKDKIGLNNANIQIHPLPNIYANKTLINELFMNLLNNALVYHGKNAVEIEIGFVEDQDNYKFYVKDNGIGIQEKDFEKIFIIFKRLHTQSEFGGTGIGLALCKRIVETHKGEIWVESEFGKGSVFYFTIKKSLL